jgi:hypothetical protein
VSAWAETSVKARLETCADYPPLEGEECGQCNRELRQGERVFRLTERDETWVCETCKGSPLPLAGGVAKDLSEASDEGMGT